MKIVCDTCKRFEYGNIDELMDKGWNRAMLYKPVRKTITRCKEHSGGMFKEIELEILKSNSGRKSR